MNLLLEIALTHIAGRRRQTLLSILGVMLGVGFSIAMAGLMKGSQDDFVGTLIDAMPHVQITDEECRPPPQPARLVFNAVAFHGLRPSDDPRGILNPTLAIASLEAWIPGRLSAGLRIQAVVRYGGTERAVEVVGVEARDEIAVSKIAEDMVAGSFNDLDGSANAIVLGTRLAERLGAGLGDSITLATSQGVTRLLKIIGLFHSGVVAADETRVYVRLKTAQVLAGRPDAINDIRIRLDDPEMAALVAARAEEILGYKAVSWQEANEDLLSAFEVRNIIMYTVVGAILLVAGFGIFNIVSIITHEKERDIAILKSLGFRERDIRLIFLGEGMMMGGAGGALGAGLGYGISRFLWTIEFEFEMATEVTRLPMAFEPIHYAIAVALALATAGIAGYLPARKAARGNPVDIIRGAA